MEGEKGKREGKSCRVAAWFNAGRQARLAAVACRVEPMVTHPAPPQTRTCAMNAYGSSGTAFCYPYSSAMGVW